MKQIKINVSTVEPDKEILIAMFSYNFKIEGFEEFEYGFDAYISSDSQLGNIIKQLSLWNGTLLSQFNIEYLVPQNWNVIWESNYDPIQVDNFVYIRAHFHKSPPKSLFEHELLINPKMAFGTGHHETTFLMMKAMRSINFLHKSVLDFGTGTGILAILAAKLGAKHLFAIDIEMPAYENTLENSNLNQTEKQIKVALGDLSLVPLKQYDLILANINRNVILDSLQGLNERMALGSMLLLSGILKSDFEKMKNAINSLKDWKITGHASKGNWSMLHITKTNH